MKKKKKALVKNQRTRNWRMNFIEYDANSAIYN